ncbi:hypothetical protein ACP70R_017337 [Stipagrostis hirtigluma subsp. patula]
MEAAGDAGPGPLAAFLPDDVVRAILARVPAESVLRFRAVRRAWRHLLTADRGFLLAHHAHQPLMPVLAFVRDAAAPGDQLAEFRVQALDLRTDELRAVAEGFTGVGRGPGLDDDHAFKVHASCDGLLLLHFLDAFYVCNPATRQWALLPPLHSSEIAALYAHAPTGEYRVLYHRGQGLDKHYYIITLSAVDPGERTRSIGRFASSASLDAALARGPSPAFASPPLRLHDCLHWPPQESQEHHMLVFHTVTEAFSWMRPPVVRDTVALLEVGGKLAMSACGRSAPVVELWLLQDYRNEVWVCAHQIGLPVGEISRFDDRQTWCAFVRSQEGDVLVVTPRHVLHCDVKGRLLKGFGREGREHDVTAHLLKESLVPCDISWIQSIGSESSDAVEDTDEDEGGDVDENAAEDLLMKMKLVPNV